MSAVAGLFELDQLVVRSGSLVFQTATTWEVSDLLRRRHYLGATSAARLVVAGYADAQIVAAQVWRWPTARMLPADGSWLELSRWCLTPEAGLNAGSRQHAAAVRLIRQLLPKVTTLVSYSDRDAGHTGALYRACNWRWCPTWMRLRVPPTQAGAWRPGGEQGSVKDRWIFPVQRDRVRDAVLSVKDDPAIRGWLSTASEAQLSWARSSLSPDLRKAVA